MINVALALASLVLILPVDVPKPKVDILASLCCISPIAEALASAAAEDLLLATDRYLLTLNAKTLTKITRIATTSNISVKEKPALELIEQDYKIIINCFGLEETRE